MADFKSMYAKLFNAITDALRILQSAQMETEELYLSQEEADIFLLNQPDNNADE